MRKLLMGLIVTLELIGEILWDLMAFLVALISYPIIWLTGLREKTAVVIGFVIWWGVVGFLAYQLWTQ